MKKIRLFVFFFFSLLFAQLSIAQNTFYRSYNNSPFYPNYFRKAEVLALPDSGWTIYNSGTLIKYDKCGNLLWKKFYSPLGEDIILKEKGGYLITGYNGSSPNSDPFLLNLDSEGN